MASNPLSFAKDIRPMFSDKDVQHMMTSFDLSNREDVMKNADAIYASVSEGWMPPPEEGETWTPEMCAKFKEWEKQGFPP